MTDKERLIELLKSVANMRTMRQSLAEYADFLLENGVIVPPCKVGDTVYVLSSDSLTGIEKSCVKDMFIEELEDGTTIKIIVPFTSEDYKGAVRIFYPEEFGKTIFLDYKEAKKALEEKNND